MTVSPSAVTFGSCSGANPKLLSFPNGQCVSTQVTVRNGVAPARIEVSGGNAVPADGGRQWTLCGGHGGAACAGGKGAPGADQYTERTVGQLTKKATAEGPLLTGAPACDTAFSSAGCGAFMPPPAAAVVAVAQLVVLVLLVLLLLLELDELQAAVSTRPLATAALAAIRCLPRTIPPKAQSPEPGMQEAKSWLDKSRA